MKRHSWALILIISIFLAAPIPASAQSRLQIGGNTGASQSPAGSGGVLLPGERIRIEPYTAPQAAPVPQAVPLPPPSPEKGALNPRTGESYPGVLGGAINPRTGEVLPKQNGGYLNPRTGEILPSQP